VTKKQSRGLDTKKRILNATLTVIKNQGMRAVRHRAIATEAGVPLGSTTYHFKSIEDLISSTFEYWYELNNIEKNPLFLAVANEVTKLAQSDVQVSKAQVAEVIFGCADNYLKNQIIDNIAHRKIELAFHNEALRNPKLSELLLDSWQIEVERLASLYAMFGTSDPQKDAEITFAIIMQSEKKAMMLQTKERQEQAYAKIRLTLKHHIYGLIGITDESQIEKPNVA
jgi:DNA-binding transcriptional regulator YbjK